MRLPMPFAPSQAHDVTSTPDQRLPWWQRAASRFALAVQQQSVCHLEAEAGCMMSPGDVQKLKDEIQQRIDKLG